MSPIICPKCGGANTSPATRPLLYCVDCQSEFGGDHRDLMATTRQIVLTTNQKGTASQNLTFTRTPTGATIEGPFLCYYPDLPEIYIDPQQWQQLLADFFKLYVLDWRSDYQNDVKNSDTTFSWELKISFDHQQPFCSRGQDLYPPYWEALMTLFTKLGLPNIGKALGQNFLQLQTQTVS
ncbi:MAG: hypothetical protein BI182_01945 [Acetobacterium sp. MES1]|uniref:hypothetical protein n=1 Tax=Acetobacterium sp. MES1 TaxID=1899015 RepID=UPI000B9CBE64|nr:hypothetical protein [Acetobacterium sp. MES1]OXS26495.1 MAG: hypothetical protein BI182_01945 [Acetobacterium sp. MES1]